MKAKKKAKPAAKVKRAPGGRPTKFDERFCKIATDLTRLGFTNDQLAKSFAVALSTLNNWIATRPEFLDAVKKGREDADANVARSLYERAIGYKHDAVKIMQYEGDPVIVPYVEHYPPDTVAGIFWLRNRRPDMWRNNPTPEDNAPPPAPVKIEVNVVDGRKADAEPDA